MAIVIGFNDDLTTEIFLRLPVKSILRFKTVSKQWLSIASCPRFRQIHASGVGNATGLFFASCLAYNFKLGFLPLSSQILPNTLPFTDNPNIYLTSSSGGLLLFQSGPYLSQRRSLRNYYVCNPTTNEFKEVAAVPQLIRDSKLVFQTLAFDPSKSPHYKIVFMCKYNDLGKEYQIVIYSSETKKFSSPQVTTLLNYRFFGIYCNDAIHWISHHNHKSTLYYFDLKRECMKESPLPPNLFPFWRYFGESRGHLHLVSVSRDDIMVHELKSDYSGLSLKYQVNLASMAKEFPKSEMYSAICDGQFTVLSILVDKEEEENVMMVLQVYGSNFVAFNFKFKLRIRLSVDPMLSSRYVHRCKLFSWQYIETLACV